MMDFQKITLTRIKKSPYSGLRKPQQGSNFALKSQKDLKIRTIRTGKEEQRIRQELEQRDNKTRSSNKSDSLTCSGTIDNNMFDSDLSITTFIYHNFPTGFINSLQCI